MIEAGSSLEIIASEVPIVAAFVVVIVGILWLTWTILGVLERTIHRDDEEDED